MFTDYAAGYYAAEAQEAKPSAAAEHTDDTPLHQVTASSEAWQIVATEHHKSSVLPRQNVVSFLCIGCFEKCMCVSTRKAYEQHT